MRSLATILLTATSFCSICQNFKPVGNEETFKKQLEAESKKITSIKSDFVQEKVMTMLTEKIVSSGEFNFKRTDKVRIEYKTPYAYLMIINGNQMFSKDGNKENRINVSSNKMFRQVNRIIVDCVQGTILYNKDFSSEIFESESLYLLELTPQNKTLKDFFQTIRVQVEKKDYSVSQIELNEPGGDKTIMRFSNKHFNQAVNDEIFTLR
ncbi:MAG TPA: outer membrane lipoprotein carrier protein LolA [Cyclobacteriaceae bacterium]|jgi:outer membrane lipoprotein-sorting protein|nr:outer membrane lipoprotein carrier protein LolA [Cyclobacteriaceae bacterium]